MRAVLKYDPWERKAAGFALSTNEPEGPSEPVDLRLWLSRKSGGWSGGHAVISGSLTFGRGCSISEVETGDGSIKRDGPLRDLSGAF